MCEVILYGDPDYPVYNDNWPAQDKKNALAYLKALECFEFIYCLVILSRTLLYLKNAVVKIQGVDQDIVSGVCSVIESCKELESVRKEVDNFSKRIFNHSGRIAETSGVSISMPCVSMQHRHRTNTEYVSIEDYFKKTVTIPFLDHLISDGTSRFTSHSKHAFRILSPAKFLLTPVLIAYRRLLTFTLLIFQTQLCLMRNFAIGKPNG